MNSPSHFKLAVCGRLALAVCLTGMFVGGYATECGAGDTAMIAAWQRTFHAPDGLKTPLRGYFMPRRPNCDCWGGGAAGWGGSPHSAAAIEPVGVVRLGRIPNELELSGPGAPPSAR